MFILKCFGGLWRHPDFLKLWAGQTVSLGGSLVSRIALPLVAILTLEASPSEVALLRVADLVPGIVIGLFAGCSLSLVPRAGQFSWPPFLQQPSRLALNQAPRPCSPSRATSPPPEPSRADRWPAGGI